MITQKELGRAPDSGLDMVWLQSERDLKWMEGEGTVDVVEYQELCVTKN